MKVISGKEAVDLWNKAGIWELFQTQPQHILTALPRGSGNRRIFYGQKYYPNSAQNFTVVIDCESDEELEHATKELQRRIPRSVAHDGQHRFCGFKE